MLWIIVLLEAVTIRKVQLDERYQCLFQDFIHVKLRVHVPGEQKNFGSSSFGDTSPDVNFVGMLGSSFKFRLLPLSTKADFGVIFHVHRTFISEYHVVELLVVFHAPQTERQSFDAVRLLYQLTVLRASLHPQ